MRSSSIENDLLVRLLTLDATPLLQPALRLMLEKRTEDLLPHEPRAELLLRSGDPEFGESIRERIAGIRGASVLLEDLSPPGEARLGDDQFGALAVAVDRSATRARELRLELMDRLTQSDPAVPADLAVLADWLVQQGDPWGVVLNAHLSSREAKDLEPLRARHALRWSSLLGAGLAHERTTLRAGAALQVTVENLGQVTCQAPSPLWASVTEVLLPLGMRPGQFQTQPVDDAAVATWFSDRRIHLTLIQGAEWVAPAFQRAPGAISVNTMVFLELPPLDWQCTGLSAVREVRAHATGSEGPRALIRACPHSGLVRATIQSSGRWRTHLAREGGWTCELEALAPGRRDEVESMASVARNAGFAQVTVR